MGAACWRALRWRVHLMLVRFPFLTQMNHFTPKRAGGSGVWHQDSDVRMSSKKITGLDVAVMFSTFDRACGADG